jgi:hypothetical protein
VAGARRARVERGVVGERSHDRRPAGADPGRRAGFRGHAPQRLGGAHRAALGLRLPALAPPDRHHRARFPHRPLRPARGGAPRGRDRRRAGGRRRTLRRLRPAARDDRPRDAAGGDLPRAVPQLLPPGRGSRGAALPRGGSDPGPGRLPVHRSRSPRSRALGRGRRRRRLGQVAVRRSRRRLPVRPSRARRPARAGGSPTVPGAS